jgi:hypothetical protein
VLYIVLAFIGWLIHGRREDRAQLIAELPSDTATRSLTAPLVMFAVLRALAMAVATAIAYGADLSHADWLPIAALVAMQPALDQTTLRAGQRLFGALIGATAAALVMLIAADKHGLKAVSFREVLFALTIVFLLHGASVRFWNYAIYTRVHRRRGPGRHRCGEPVQLQRRAGLQDGEVDSGNRVRRNPSNAWALGRVATTRITSSTAIACRSNVTHAAMSQRPSDE